MQRNSNPPARQRGLTLVETCVTMSIACVLLGTALPGFNDMLARRKLTGVATELLGDIAYVRGAAVARNQPVRLSFHALATGSCYVVHTGAAADCRCSADGIAQCSGSAVALKTVLQAASGVAVQANVRSMLFDPVRGTTSPAGTVRVVGDSGAIHHVVNIMGRARSCSPSAGVPGYKAC